jgi:inward rectifier potassium channel
MFRVGNERGNAIVDAQIRAVVTRSELTAEGERIYRVHDVKLVRDRALLLNRSFTVSHRIDEHSVFLGQSRESLVEREYELQVIVVGLDDTVIQTVHASYMYYANDIVFGARLRDVLSDAPDGALVLDMRNFHELDPIP